MLSQSDKSALETEKDEGRNMSLTSWRPAVPSVRGARPGVRCIHDELQQPASHLEKERGGKVTEETQNVRNSPKHQDKSTRGSGVSVPGLLRMAPDTLGVLSQLLRPDTHRTGAHTRVGARGERPEGKSHEVLKPTSKTGRRDISRQRRPMGLCADGTAPGLGRPMRWTFVTRDHRTSEMWPVQPRGSMLIFKMCIILNVNGLTRLGATLWDKGCFCLQ